jgi:hypothetical protein
MPLLKLAQQTTVPGQPAFAGQSGSVTCPPAPPPAPSGLSPSTTTWTPNTGHVTCNQIFYLQVSGTLFANYAFCSNGTTEFVESFTVSDEELFYFEEHGQLPSLT